MANIALAAGARPANPWYSPKYRAPILTEIESFLQRTGTAATRFGTEALDDPRFVFDLRKGRDPRSQTVAQVRSFMSLKSEG